MAEIRIVKVDSSNEESGVTAEIMDSMEDSFTLKSSSLEEIATSEINRPKTLISDSKIEGQKSLDSVSFTSPIVEEANGVKLINGDGELYPLTPSPDSEAVEISSASDQTDDLEILTDCETPTGNLFNPFAPGPEELVLAPLKKMQREFKIPTRRQLNFDTCCDFEEKVVPAIADEEDCILESVCKSFIELIVSNQLKEICNEDLVEEEEEEEDREEDNLSDDTFEGFKTPTSVPLLTGIAETCPDAPMRPSSKTRKFDQTVCRKLDFGSQLI
ncbi:uncharacterized protein A4U43_C08F33040 [Asparagus officinalis]|uniref:unknown protein 1-like n=1 Tax=Asparagus officinalis TaxID=4686 RepID=UPI00098E7DA3|nr:unknown protein 1-like [Asparagus officinalis]ONK61736.1 uncharacterized protein A4U43_C08F33040 [Asparagus officinalis]